LIVLREIRGVAQGRQWFQDDYFDLFVFRDADGRLARFQLCYARDTRHERALDWARGRGLQHLRVRQRYDDSQGREQSGALSLDAAAPAADLRQRFEAAAQRLPAGLRAFILKRLRAKPSRRSSGIL
jgi:hypothetical protein